MASILRSGKFVRYFAGLTRSIIFNTVRETEGSFVQNSQCLCSSLIHGFATAAPKPTDHNLERSLKRLDHDVRRTGRISRRDIEEVLEEIRQQRSATSSQSLLVIRCCGNLVPEELPEIRTALVQEIWKTLNTLNVPMDISHYNALLRVYLENEHAFSPTDFLTDLESKGVEPNRVTYQRLIARYCQLGDIEGATRILEFMREKGLPVNENVFNALILGHSEANDMESAGGILTVMKQAGLEPSADTYTTLLCCYGRHGDLESITRILNECEKNDIYLLDKDLLDIVYALTCHGFGNQCQFILNKIRKSVGYNQDAVNIILRLTNKGYEEIAYEILKTMPRSTRPDGELTDTGNFFIRQLVKAQRPITSIIKICHDITAAGLNTKALQIATESSLDNGLTTSSLLLLKEMKNVGLPIRQHYFWPIICSSRDSTNDIIEILKKMQNEFEINPSSETIRDYVIPNLKEKNSNKIINLLREAGVSTATAAVSTAYNALNLYKINDAAIITESCAAFYPPGLFRKLLTVALSKTDDYQSYTKIIRQIYDNLPRGENLAHGGAGKSELIDETDNENTLVTNDDTAATAVSATAATNNQIEFIGYAIIDAVQYFKRNRSEIMENILNNFVEQGFTIKNEHAEKIQDILGAEMTTHISELLEKLSSGELEPCKLENRRSRTSMGFENMSVEYFENRIQTLEAKNENTNSLKRNLLLTVIKSKDLEKTQHYFTKFESENFIISAGLYAQLIDLYCHHGKLDDVMNIYEKLRSKEPDFLLDNYKVIRICSLLVKEKRIAEAYDFLVKNRKENSLNDLQNGSFNYTTTCWRVLNVLAEEGNEIDVKRMFDVFIENNYVTVNNVLLGPLVKVHLIKNDLKAAVDTFDTLCQKYKSTPWKNELACRLIQAEDASNLQRLTDLSTNIHGEVNSLYDLVFSFVECGRIRQARKILETPGLRTRPQRINSACERYHQEGMTQPLEGLIEATKDLNHIDRNDIYYNLLLSYCKETENPEKALGLWTKMQEDDITPTDAFLIKLSKFLNDNNIEVPFVVPSIHKNLEKNVEKQPILPAETKQPRRQKNIIKDVGTVIITENLQKFKTAIHSKDVDAALLAKENLNNGEKLSLSNQSHLIELLVKSDRMSEATKLVIEMLTNNNYPLARIFKFYLNKLANSGDITTINHISQLISNDTKKLLSFDNRYCHAMIVAGRIEEYLTQLLVNIENATTEDELNILREKFPRGGALGILEKHPELTAKFEEIAEKYADKGIVAPINILWINKLINGDEKQHKKIFEKYLKSSPRLMFQGALKASRETQNEKLAAELIDYLKQTKISEGALGNAYSCYLDVLSAKGNFEEGLIVLKKAIEDVCLENLNTTALSRLKVGVEAKGTKFPYKISNKNSNDTTSSSSSSSSGSSDDDVTPPKPDAPSQPKIV